MSYCDICMAAVSGDIRQDGSPIMFAIMSGFVCLSGVFYLTVRNKRPTMMYMRENVSSSL